MVLEYVQRFLNEWITNCKKLNFEAASLFIEGLMTCSWDGKSCYDTVLMRHLGKYIDISMSRDHGTIRPV